MDAEEYFKEYREWLNNEIKRLYCYFYVYKRIHERFEDRLEEINFAPCFFQTVIDGLFSAIILWIDKLASRSSERGLYNFLNFVRSNIGLFSVNNLRRRRNYSKNHWMVRGREAPTVQSVDEDIKRIEGLPSIKSISLRRDKFHAHFDKEYFFDRKALQKEAPILRSDLETILGTIKELVNKYSADYDGNLFHYQPLNVNDIDIILDRLHGQEIAT